MFAGSGGGASGGRSKIIFGSIFGSTLGSTFGSTLGSTLGSTFGSILGSTRTSGAIFGSTVGLMRLSTVLDMVAVSVVRSKVGKVLGAVTGVSITGATSVFTSPASVSMSCIKVGSVIFASFNTCSAIAIWSSIDNTESASGDISGVVKESVVTSGLTTGGGIDVSGSLLSVKLLYTSAPASFITFVASAAVSIVTEVPPPKNPAPRYFLMFSGNFLKVSASKYSFA